MPKELLNPRRVPRVPLRAAVELRHRLTRWSGHTEDVGPGGCQVVSPRAVDPGRALKLVIRCDALGRPIEAAGTVAWARAEEPVRLGIAFEPGAGAGWFDALLAADPVASRAARSVPDRLPGPARVYLGRPPELVVDFSPVELEILRRVGAGTSADALARSFGEPLDERIAGAIFSLLARRALVLDEAAAVGVGRWKDLLADGAAGGDGAGDAGRSARARKLYEEAMVHVGAGRLGFAVDRLREARQLAPGDAGIEAVLTRIARWA